VEEGSVSGHHSDAGEEMTEYKFDAKTILSRYKQGIQVTKSQRDREREALKFMVPEYQWSESAKAMRNGSPIGGAAVPARPCLSISKIDQPIQLVQNQFQNAHLGVNIHPLSEEANKETAEILQGLYRKIERDSNAVLPRSWAFDRAVEAGWGVYRIVTEYDEQSDNEFDQRILLKRILRQDAVVFDPSAQEPDYSDGEWAFVTSYVPIERFRREYPAAEISQCSDSVLSEIMVDEPEWVIADGEQKAVLVAEYFCKQYESVPVKYPSPNGRTIERQKKIQSVMWSKVCAGTKDELQELESQEWNGQWIPLIPVVGKEMQVYDKDRRYVGIVEPAMDGQRMYNYAVTTAVEIAALEPKAPFIGAEGQFEGHEEKWNQANVRNWPYLEYKPTTLEGNLNPPPQRMSIDASRLSVSLQLMEKADDAIQATTFTPDPALGNLNSRDRSGKAIQALQGQSEASTSNYMSNMAQISMTYEAKVILDMIPRIYDRPGRVAMILDIEDNPKPVMLNAPFTVEPTTGRPLPAPQVPVIGGPSPMTTSGAAPMAQAGAPKVYDLSKGKYGVSVTIGKSYQSRFEAGRDQMAEMLGADPALMPILGDLYFKYNDAPWANEAAKRMKSIFDAAHPELAKGEDGQETPEQLKAELMAAKQQMQQMQQQLMAAAEQIKTDQAKQQAMLEKAKIDAESKVAAAGMNAQVEAQLAQIQARFDAELERIKTEGELMLQQQEQQFEMRKLQIEQHFEAMENQKNREAEAEKAEHAAEQAGMMSEREDARSESQEEGE
jgi:hypothetical protein